jgi:hypothetical protein
MPGRRKILVGKTGNERLTRVRETRSMFAQTETTEIVRRSCVGGASAKAVPVQRSKNKRLTLEAGVGLIRKIEKSLSVSECIHIAIHLLLRFSTRRPVFPHRFSVTLHGMEAETTERGKYHASALSSSTRRTSIAMYIVLIGLGVLRY